MYYLLPLLGVNTFLNLVIMMGCGTAAKINNEKNSKVPAARPPELVI